MSPRPQRRSSNSDLRRQIIAGAWQQIAAEGAPALSLRAIARALGVTAPAIYNYYPDRDALVTALIVEAFTSFGEAQQAALADLPAANHAARLQALGLAYRQWAITYPERYHLIFGTPIAGYQAPAEITMPAAACSLDNLVDVLAAADAAGCLRVDEAPSMTPAARSMLHNWQSSRSAQARLEVLFLALMVWSRVHGLVSLEIGNQFPPFITDAGELYQREVARLVAQNIQMEQAND